MKVRRIGKTMTSRDFAYWLQGFFEIAKPEAFNADQTELVKRHLALVFKHEIDPSMGGPKHQGELNGIHNGQPKIPVSMGWPTDNTRIRC